MNKEFPDYWKEYMYIIVSIYKKGYSEYHGLSQLSTSLYPDTHRKR
jgi:hypothetical protein